MRISVNIVAAALVVIAGGRCLAQSQGGGAPWPAMAAAASEPTVMTVLQEDWISDGWQDNLRFTMRYDADGFQIGWLFELWDASTNRLENFSERTSTYEAGRLKENVDRDWDPTAKRWVNSRRYTPSYGADGLDSLTLVSQWTSGRWQPILRYVYLRDTAARRTETRYEAWKAATGQWQPTQRLVTIANTDGKPEEELEQNWDAAGATWVNLRKTVRVYGPDKREQQSVAESWTNNVWTMQLRTSYQYEGARLMRTLDEKWAAADGAWKNFRQRDHEYYSNDSLYRTTTRAWDAESQEWVNDYRSTYSQRMPSGVEREVAAPGALLTLAAYPNPAAGRFVVEVPGHLADGRATVEVMDLTGRSVQRTTATGTRVPLELSASGTYLVRVTAGGVVVAAGTVVNIQP